MNKPPAFQFYPDDFLGGTSAMTNEECGAYIRLLCVQWSRGFVTEHEITRIASLSSHDGVAIVKSKFERDEQGHYRNKRLSCESEKQRQYRDSQAKSGKKGAYNRWGRHGKPIATPMAKHSSPSPSPISTCTSTGKGVSGGFAKPSIEDVRRYGAQIGMSEPDCDACYDYYESNGWRVGKNPMKCWMATMRNWKRNGSKYGHNNKAGGTCGAKSFDRNKGTLNEGHAERYDLKKIQAARSVQNAKQPDLATNA